MANIAAPAALQARKDTTANAPNRKQASDGICPSAAHSKANPYSDHEPGKAGYCHAVDITNDPANGVNSRAIATSALSDSRTTYVISNGEIAYATGQQPAGKKAMTWYKYTGTNKHTVHCHISIKDTKAACQSTAHWPWYKGGGGSPAKPPAATPTPTGTIVRTFAVPSVIIRATPGGSDTKKRLANGVKATMSKVQGDWGFIGNGWVSRIYVLPVAKTRIVNGNGVRLRSSTTTRSTRNIVTQLNKGNCVKLLGRTRTEDGYKWQNVTYGTSTGWIAEKYLSA